jgi:hypothetical protein
MLLKYWFAKNLRKPNPRNYLFCLHGGVFKLAWPVVKNQNGSPQGAAAEGGLFLAHICRWNAAPIDFGLHPLGWGESRCRVALVAKVRASAQPLAPAWPGTGCAFSDGLCQFESTP